MEKVEVKELLEAGVHFGHLTRKWNPNMAPYIYMERNGIHIINLYKTAAKIEETAEALRKIAVSGKKILFVATKKQSKFKPFSYCFCFHHFPLLVRLRFLH